MATGWADVSRVDAYGLFDRRVGWKRGAHEVVRRSGFSCTDGVVGGPGGLSGIRSEHGDFEDGDIPQVDGEFQLPPEKKRKLSRIISDKEEKKGQLLKGSVVGVALESPLVFRNVYMSRWASDEYDVPGDREEVLRGSRSRSMQSDCRDSSVTFSGADIQVPTADGGSNVSMGSPHRSVDMRQGCRSIFQYERLNKIGEGTYGKVYRARDKKTGEIVALKKVKISANSKGYALREFNILNSLCHPNIVNVKEVVTGDLDSVFMVMECMDHDLKGVMEVMKEPFGTGVVKCLMLQLLEGVKYLHNNSVLHRDLKTSNILLNNNCELKICDFGMSRQYNRSPNEPYTPLVVTLWYRAPELLLGAKKYSTAIDMWSVGCIMAELLAKTPLFAGRNEIDQLEKIFRLLGTPNKKIWPGFAALPGAKAKFAQQQSNNCLRKKFPAASFTGSRVLSGRGFDLLTKLLAYDPEKRITADDALNHPWFHEFPLPKPERFSPTFPPQSATTRIRHATKRSWILRHAWLKQMCTMVRYLVKQIDADEGTKILVMMILSSLCRRF